MILTENEQTQVTAAEITRRGGIVAFRTDTFYGLGVDPFNRAALQALRELKGREDGKPILVLIADIDEIDRFIMHRSDLFNRVSARFWPGPLTLVGKARKELPDELTAATGTIGVRLPNDTSVRDLVRACGGALTATSANPSGQPAARSAQDVATYFPAGVDLVIKGGEVIVTEPSTVLDLSGEEPRLIREGAVTREALLAILSIG